MRQPGKGLFSYRVLLLFCNHLTHSKMKQQASVRRTYKKEMVVARSTLVHLRHSARAQPPPPGYVMEELSCRISGQFSTPSVGDSKKGALAARSRSKRTYSTASLGKTSISVWDDAGERRECVEAANKTTPLFLLEGLIISCRVWWPEIDLASPKGQRNRQTEFWWQYNQMFATEVVYTANQYIIDGCAIFFRNDKFKLIIKYELEFDNQLFPVVDMLQPNQRNEVCFRLMKGNIAVVLILETVGNDNMLNDVKFRIGVANTHIHADSNFQDAKMFQVVNFIKGLEEISKSQIPLLICGDMNSLPKSDPYKFVREGKVRHISNKIRDPLGIQKHMVFCHSLRLASAYSSLIQSENVERKQKAKMNSKTGEPKFTNFGSGHPRTLDYIFFTENDLKVEKLLELLDKKNIGGHALPSPLWSSDHIALMASFSYKQGYISQPISVPRNPWEGNTPGLKLLLMEEFGHTTCTSRYCKALS
ncbi:hypothetical protein AgCh_023315 [Apium graveolens]